MKGAGNNFVDIVKLLISKGADVNIRAKSGFTALSFGMFNSCISSIIFYHIYLITFEAASVEVINIIKAVGGVN